MSLAAASAPAPSRWGIALRGRVGESHILEDRFVASQQKLPYLRIPDSSSYSSSVTKKSLVLSCLKGKVAEKGVEKNKPLFWGLKRVKMA